MFKLNLKCIKYLISEKKNTLQTILRYNVINAIILEMYV